MSTNINTASSPTPPSAHGLTAGIYGVYCTRCNDTVKKNGNLLFPPDDNTIRNHLRKYHCYVGDTAPNAIQIERELARSQEAIHSVAKRNHELAVQKIALIFPNGSDTSIHRAYVCNNCGFSAKTKRNFSYHFGPRNYYGCLKDSHASKGMVDVCTGICNITCPKSFLEKAANGDLVLPKRQRLNDTNNKNIEAGQATAAITTTPPIQLPQQQFLQQFQSSETQLSAAMANTSYYDDGAYDEARIDEALSPFVDTTSTNRGDRGNIHFVKMHRQLVIKIIDADFPQENADQYWRTLALMSSTTHQNNDKPIVKVLEDAGKVWFKSGNANNDVNRITPFHRAKLFQVGEPEAPDAETLVKGKTFVRSYNLEKIVAEFIHLINFIARFKPSLIEKQLQEAEGIYDYHICNCEKEIDAKTVASQKIIDTNIIVGTVLAAVLEPPSTANGLNTMDYFLVSRVIVSAAGRPLKFKHGGGIG